jgi:hypothetical protein
MSWVRIDLPDGQIKRASSESKSSITAQNIPLSTLLKSNVKIRHPVPQEGRFAVVTNAGWDVMDARASARH